MLLHSQVTVRPGFFLSSSVYHRSLWTSLTSRVTFIWASCWALHFAFSALLGIEVFWLCFAAGSSSDIYSSEYSGFNGLSKGSRCGGSFGYVWTMQSSSSSPTYCHFCIPHLCPIMWNSNALAQTEWFRQGDHVPIIGSNHVLQTRQRPQVWVTDKHFIFSRVEFSKHPKQSVNKIYLHDLM